MNRNGIFLLAFVLLRFSVDCYGHEVEGDTMNNNKSMEDSGGQKMDLNSVKVDEEKNNRNKDREMRGETSNDPERDKNGKGSSDVGLASKTVTKENTRVEGCDASNMCIDEKNKFVACLRVPGKDAPLSLLIQNKGTGPLSINISAPDFVKLEQNTVQLQAEEDRKVEVSLEKGVNDPLIILSAGDSHCNLSFKGESSPVPAYTNLFTYTFFIYMSLATVVLFGVAWLWVRFWQMHHQKGRRYLKVEAGLPISSEGKKETVAANGWDNSWGDCWDDEEAPKTPSKHVLTPSSKGLASRRSNKDAWKD